MPQLTFWYEFASPYSWLAAERIEGLAAAAGVEIVWRPFLLGPIFAAQGWKTSPFNLYPAKGRYMVRDMQRLAAARGLAFRLPDPFPQSSLTATRLAHLGCREGWVARFSRAVFTAEFVDGRDISDAAVLTEILTDLGLAGSDWLALSATPSLKESLRAVGRAAEEIGIFGAPSFVTSDGEVFWGDDRLEAAINWGFTCNTTAISI